MNTELENIYLLNEENFLEEIFLEVQRIDEKDWSKVYTKSFDPQSLLDIQRHNPKEFNKDFSKEFNMEEWAEKSSLYRYEFFAKKYQQIGVIISVDIFTLQNIFLVKLIPKVFIDYYNRKYADKKNNNEIFKKLSICISDKGIWLKDFPSKKYEIRGKRFDIIKFLNEKPHRLDELSSRTEQDKYIVSKAIKEINKNFKKCLELAQNAPDLIGHSDTNGYYLDDENYILEFKLD